MRLFRRDSEAQYERTKAWLADVKDNIVEAADETARRQAAKVATKKAAVAAALWVAGEKCNETRQETYKWACASAWKETYPEVYAEAYIKFLLEVFATASLGMIRNKPGAKDCAEALIEPFAFYNYCDAYHDVFGKIYSKIYGWAESGIQYLEDNEYFEEASEKAYLRFCEAEAEAGGAQRAALLLCAADKKDEEDEEDEEDVWRELEWGPCPGAS